MLYIVRHDLLSLPTLVRKDELLRELLTLERAFDVVRASIDGPHALDLQDPLRQFLEELADEVVCGFGPGGAPAAMAAPEGLGHLVQVLLRD